MEIIFPQNFEGVLLFSFSSQGSVEKALVTLILDPFSVYNISPLHPLFFSPSLPPFVPPSHPNLSRVPIFWMLNHLERISNLIFCILVFLPYPLTDWL